MHPQYLLSNLFVFVNKCKNFVGLEFSDVNVRGDTFLDWIYTRDAFVYDFITTMKIYEKDANHMFYDK